MARGDIEPKRSTFNHERKILEVLIGTGNSILALRLGSALILALVLATAGVLFLELPLWNLAILAAALLVTFRLGISIGTYVSGVTLEEKNETKLAIDELTQEEIYDLARNAAGIWKDHPQIKDSVEWVRMLRESLSRRIA